LFGIMIANLNWQTTLSSPQKAQFSAFFRTFMGEALQRTRATAVALERAFPTRPEALDALLRVAGQAARAGDYDLAMRINREVLPRKGSAATAEQYLDAAFVCLHALNLLCGDQYLAKARQAGERAGAPIAAQTLAQVAKIKTEARQVLELRGASEYEQRLRLARLDLDLDRRTAARDLFRALLREQPDDARPYVGLAKLEINDGLRVAKAEELLARAGTKNREADFYHVALGTWFGYHLAPGVWSQDRKQIVAAIVQELPHMHELLLEFARFEPDRAEWLSIALDLSVSVLPLFGGEDETAPARLAEMLAAFGRAADRASVAYAAHPKSEHLLRLRLLLTLFERDRRRASATLIEVEHSCSNSASLTVMRRSVMLLLALKWNDSQLQDRISRELAAIENPSPSDRLIALDLRAARERSTAVEVWRALAVEYAGLGALTDPEQEQRRQNNMGLAFYRAGDRDRAKKAWELASAAGLAAPAINLYASSSAAEREAAWSLVEQRLNDKNIVDARRIADTWHIRFTVSNPAERRKQIKSLEQKAPTNIQTWFSIAHPRLALDKKIEVSAGYSTSDGLVTQLDLAAAPWLMLE
jgi:hypothetical protein